MINKEPKPKGEAWQAYRTKEKRIGGSDTPAILGFSKYKSAYTLWCEKTGKIIPEDISDKEAVRLGNDLEDYVAKRFAEATGKKVQNSNFIWTNTDYPWAHANLDRVVVGEKAILECKTTDSWEIAKACQEGNYPPAWYSQMTHYMMVTGFEKAYLGVLCFGKGFYWFTLERNEEEIKALAEAEKDFWKLVETNTPPAADGSDSSIDSLKVIYADRRPDQVDLTPYGSSLEMYMALKEQKKQIDAQLGAIQAEVMQYMGNASTGTYGKYKVTWSDSSRKTFDKKAFEMAHGTIPDAFYKESTVTKFEIRKGK